MVAFGMRIMNYTIEAERTAIILNPACCFRCIGARWACLSAAISYIVAEALVAAETRRRTIASYVGMGKFVGYAI